MDCKLYFRISVLILLFCVTACDLPDPKSSSEKVSKLGKKIALEYPHAYPDSTVVDEYHAVTVADSYRWLERYSNSSGEWLSDQRSITQKYFNSVPQRNRMEERLRKYWDYERFTLPIKRGNHHYYFVNDGLQQQDVLYRFAKLEDQPDLVLDPNKLPSGQILQDAKISKDGSKVAYQVSEGGSSWRKIRIRDIDSGKDLEEVLVGVKHSCIAWHGDGFFYSRYDRAQINSEFTKSDKFHQVFYHRLGTSQDDDEMVFADRHNPYTILDVHTTSDERFLVIKVLSNTLGNAMWFKDLSKEESDLMLLADENDYEFAVIDNIGENLLIKTNYGAPQGRMVLVNSRNPEERYWEEIIPETEEVLQTAELVGNRIVACYLHKTYSVVKVFEESGAFVGNLDLPEKGKVKCFEGERNDNLAFFGYSTLVKPMSLYSVNVSEMSIKPYRTSTVSFDVEGYKVEQRWFQSYDRTKVSMYIVHRKGLKLDGERPTLMVVNGGLGQKLVPEFNPTGLHLLPYILEKGGVGVLVNVRGGKEMGRSWQLAGIRSKKQNAMDDFQAAAEYLFSNNYTSPKHLAVYGRENGGLIVGTSLIQRPDLFKVVIAEDGIFDMLRFQQFSIGWFWKQEFGTTKEGKSFDYLYAYSPMHNIDKEDYPATLFVTGRQNDMVVPLHSYKFLAGLQYHQKAKTNPLLLSVNDDGYAVNKTYLKHKLKRSADILAFLEYNLEEKAVQ